LISTSSFCAIDFDTSLFNASHSSSHNSLQHIECSPLFLAQLDDALFSETITTMSRCYSYLHCSSQWNHFVTVDRQIVNSGCDLSRQTKIRSKHFASIATTDTLKGVAISAVLINHYLNLNISGDWAGFAYQWVSIFFLLSGYGLFHSLESRFRKKITVKKVLLYYYERVIRIFPLLWVAWFIQFIISRGDISYWIPLGINASGHFWFIPALLQCYFLSPFLYWSIKKNVTLSVALILVIFIAINFVLIGGYAPHVFIRLAKITNSNWMEMYFFHIIVFTGGLLIPSFMRKEKPADSIIKQKFHSASFWAFTVLIVFFFTFLKHYSHISPFFRREFFLISLIMIIMN